MQEEKIVINLKGDKVAVLSIESFDGDISDEIVKIDYNNLLGEIITFPVVYNRIANLRAEVANILAEAKLSLEIQEAQLFEKHKKKLIAGGEKGTDKATEAAVLQDPLYATNKKIYLRRLRDFDYVDAMYWSAQSKDRKLNVLVEKISPDEFEKELVEGSINGVMIKMKKKAIKDVK
jgi:hypothetical protein